MESTATQFALLAATVWVWVWLILTVRRNIPLLIYAQQRLGLSTPRLFFRLRDRLPWLAVGGVVVTGMACLVPQIRTAAAAGLFVVSAGLLTLVHIRSVKLLRIVKPVLAQLEGDTPHDRFADKVLMRLYDRGPNDPPPVAA
jgi:hypothetical protein